MWGARPEIEAETGAFATPLPTSSADVSDPYAVVSPYWKWALPGRMSGFDALPFRTAAPVVIELAASVAAVGVATSNAPLSHLTPAIDSISDDTWRAAAAKNFEGEIIVAHDFTVV